MGDELLFLVKTSIDTVVDFADTYGYDIKIIEDFRERKIRRLS